ncbi:hypothetical protein M8J77_018287 [Diaphorina citri]|nr:hypothetical protein M8J77_018287 [Diaphorina citri]
MDQSVEILDSPTAKSISEYKILLDIDQLKQEMLAVQNHVRVLSGHMESERKARLLLQNTLVAQIDNFSLPENVP